MRKIGFYVSATVLLTACSHFATTADKHYLQSRSGSTIAVPSPLTGSNISHFYDLPPQNQNPVVNIRPPVVKLNQQGSS
ncbi:MAG: hypothetical protein H0U57_01380 [Tatlockia sp.]|nr:hypothetical protein [Tatlockia sp.]